LLARVANMSSDGEADKPTSDKRLLLWKCLSIVSHFHPKSFEAGARSWPVASRRIAALDTSDRRLHRKRLCFNLIPQPPSRTKTISRYELYSDFMSRIGNLHECVVNGVALAGSMSPALNFLPISWIGFINSFVHSSSLSKGAKL
jgi:hypothetical protein